MLLRHGQPNVSLQPAPGGGYQVRAATPIRAGPGAGALLLIATYPVPQRLSDLAATVQTAYQQYGQLSYLRGWEQPVTAVEDGEMALGAEFPVPDDRTAGSYQKVERKVGDFKIGSAFLDTLFPVRD